MIFKRKKAAMPKNRLGIALFKYDSILNKELQKVIQSIKLQKPLNSSRAAIILDDVFSKLDEIAINISRENFKTDYRSDKARDIILELFKDLSELLRLVSSCSFDYTNPLLEQSKTKLSAIIEARQSLKNKMKETDSDYQ